jgi:hypothetical protein
MQTTATLLVVVLGLFFECFVFIWFVARYVQKNVSVKVKVSFAPLSVSLKIHITEVPPGPQRKRDIT